MGDIISTLGKVAGPIVGLATGNPLIGALVGGGSSLLGGATGAEGGIDPKSILTGGGLGALGGVGGKALGSNNPFQDPTGQPDMGKMIGAGLAGANLLGAQQQRKSQQDYLNAQTGQKNNLMSSILAPQNYNLPQMTPGPYSPNPAQGPPNQKPMQPSAPGIGA